METKNEKLLPNFCPKCGSPKFKTWDELTADEKFLVERMPLSSGFSSEERKRHRFCSRCFYEEISNLSAEA